MTAPVLIGLDLGTSSVKALALDADGRVLGRVRRSYPTARPEPGAAEQAPADWVSGIVGALGELAGIVPAERWAGIGLSAMLPTLVCLDAQGEPIGSAIVWEDTRAEPEARELLAGPTGHALGYAQTGQHLDGRYLLPMFERLRRAEPERAARTRTLVGAKDYLFRLLTGELCTDPSTAAGFGGYDLSAGAWGALPEGVALPAVLPSDTARPLDPGFARVLGLPAGLPIVLGAADSVLGALGLGAEAPGDIAYVAGTSTVILGISHDAGIPERGLALVTPLAGPGTGLELDLVATGSALAWLAGFTGRADAAALVAEAAAIDPDDAPLVLPFLGPGEQGVRWDPALTGSVLGLTLASTPAELARGLLTGLVLESRRCVGALLSTPGWPEAGRLLVTGSSAGSPVFLQDLADATGREVLSAPEERDHSAIGAALVAAAALGITAVRPDSGATPVRPDPGTAAAWAARAAAHEAALHAVRTLP